MNVFELFGTIAIKNRDANAAIQDTTQKAERAGTRIQAAFKKIGETSVKIAKPIIAGAAAIGTAYSAAIESTRDYRTAMAKLETAFVTNGHSAEAAKSTYQELQAVLGETDQAVEAANHLAVMTDNEKDLKTWTEICTGIFATFGDSLPIEGLTESANETSKVGQVTGSLADALNWAGISEDDFNKKLKACRTEQERQDLIMNTLYWTYQKASEQYKETGKNVLEANRAQEKLNAAMAKLGEIGEPIMTGIKNAVANMINAAVPHLESIITAFSDLGTTWSEQVWPMFQEDFKARFGIELPDWETFKANVKSGWETVKTEIGNSFVVKAILDIPENWSAVGQKLVEGWNAVKEWYTSSVGDFFRVNFNVELPSWSDLASRIAAGWNSVKSSIAGLFNIGVSTSYGGGVVGDFGGGGNSVPNYEAGRSFPMSNAGGLDRVPYDGYLTRLHKDETVLNKADATVWRGGGNDRIEALLSQLVNIMSAGQVIQLDSGIMAGQLAPAIDAKLGAISRNKGRGN